MRVIIQRVQRASVSIDGNVVGKCGYGYLLLVGFTNDDNEQVVDKMVDKVIQLRINEDENGKTNLNLAAKNGEILSISQFTLYANTTKGNKLNIYGKNTAYSSAEDLYSTTKSKQGSFRLRES